MKIFSYLILLLIIIIGVTFAILNSTPVTVHYYIGDKQLALSLLLVIAFMVGLIVGFSAFFIKNIKLRSELRRTKKKLRIADAEIKNLRTIPIKDEH